MMGIMELGSFLMTQPSGVLGYLDPGSGSLILQAVLAAIAMSAVMVKIYWNKLLVFFRLRPGAPAPSAVGSDEAADAAKKSNRPAA